MTTKWLLFFALLIPNISFAETTDLVCDFPNKLSIDLLIQTDGALCMASNFHSTLNLFKPKILKNRASGEYVTEASEALITPVCVSGKTENNQSQISKLQIDLNIGGTILLNFENDLDGAVRLVNNSNLKSLRTIQQVLGKCEKRGLPGMPGVSGGN